VCPRATRAQQGERVRRVGVLSFGAEGEPSRLPTLLHDELQKLGWIEGRNLRLDFRFGAGDVDRTRAAAADLVRLAPDVIFPVGGPALVAAQQETNTIPIVFVGAGDPVETGRVKNSGHPEGNATGFANAFGSIGGKWLQLLKEAAPNVTRVAFLYVRGSASTYAPSLETAARALGMQLVAISVSDAAAMKPEIESFAAEPNGGLIPSPGILSPTVQRELMRLAEQYRLPAITGARFFVANGGLMSYDGDPVEVLRGALSYVDRILRGAKVSELPVQYPTTFQLIVNLKAAKAIGLTIPASFLLRADQVIE
jgi:putative tryptophan/tyrosine transport system substrate-binding protein